MRPLKILFVAAEAAPFSQTGGLAEVVRDLPVALRRLGHDVRVVLPRHRGKLPFPVARNPRPLGVPTGWGEEWCAILEPRMAEEQGPVYLLEHNDFFDRPGIYGNPWDYPDNLERFSFLSLAALQLCKALGFYPDIVHAHDWHTGLLPVYLNVFERGRELGRAASVFTIHNLGYQGWFDPGRYRVTGLPWDRNLFNSLEAHGRLNLLKSGLEHSTLITAVSPTYAQEIQTREQGHGLESVLRSRSGELYGVLNGIDENIWNPATDPMIPARYDVDDLAGKAACKAALQDLCGFEVNPRIPLVGIVSRLVHQKGLDHVAEAMYGLLGLGLQMVILGTGERALEERFRGWSRAFPRQLAFQGAWDEQLSHWIEAGSDFFLMPSRYEPCGLNQMYSLRYGTLPIVRAVGGLEDTVQNCDPATGRGTGFKFHDLTPDSVWNTVHWAVEVYRHQPLLIEEMRRRAMRQPLGWDQAARVYEHLYGIAIEEHHA